MKNLHIENIHIHLSNQQPPAGLIDALAIAGVFPEATNLRMATQPAIGEKWPGLDATYAGISLSRDGQCLVHLILWDDAPDKVMTYDHAVEAAEKINSAMKSHIPTRQQSIHLFERLHDLFNKDRWHWTLDKTKSGETAFVQFFDYGIQSATPSAPSSASVPSARFHFDSLNL